MSFIEEFTNFFTPKIMYKKEIFIDSTKLETIKSTLEPKYNDSMNAEYDNFKKLNTNLTMSLYKDRQV